ncbi:MAG: hypothetical protein Q8O33_04215 [Pseudomonadota bacterium]|nr:hypothetical protein [Pseudomonadota bacterium]
MREPVEQNRQDDEDRGEETRKCRVPGKLRGIRDWESLRETAQRSLGDIEREGSITGASLYNPPSGS